MSTNIMSTNIKTSYLLDLSDREDGSDMYEFNSIKHYDYDTPKLNLQRVFVKDAQAAWERGVPFLFACFRNMTMNPDQEWLYFCHGVTVIKAYEKEAHKRNVIPAELPLFVPGVQDIANRFYAFVLKKGESQPRRLACASRIELFVTHYGLSCSREPSEGTVSALYGNIQEGALNHRNAKKAVPWYFSDEEALSWVKFGVTKFPLSSYFQAVYGIAMKSIPRISVPRNTKIELDISEKQDNSRGILFDVNQVYRGTTFADRIRSRMFQESGIPYPLIVFEGNNRFYFRDALCALEAFQKQVNNITSSTPLKDYSDTMNTVSRVHLFVFHKKTWSRIFSEKNWTEALAIYISNCVPKSFLTEKDQIAAMETLRKTQCIYMYKKTEELKGSGSAQLSLFISELFFWSKLSHKDFPSNEAIKSLYNAVIFSRAQAYLTVQPDMPAKFKGAREEELKETREYFLAELRKNPKDQTLRRRCEDLLRKPASSEDSKEAREQDTEVDTKANAFEELHAHYYTLPEERSTVVLESSTSATTSAAAASVASVSAKSSGEDQAQFATLGQMMASVHL